MATKSQKVKLGIFVTAFFVLFGGTLVIFAGMKVWEDKENYTIYFTDSVSGLELGAPVKLRGVRVGTVTDIKVDPVQIERVTVSVELKPETPIKEDSRATLQFQGITGLKFIEISDGTVDANPLPEGSVIPEGETTLSRITGRAEDITHKVELVMNNMLDITREENRRRVDSILAETDKALKNFNELSQRIIALSDAVLEVIDENRSNIRRTLTSIQGTSNRAEQTMVSVEGLVRDVRGTIENMRLEQTVANLNETNKMVQDRLLEVDFSGTLQRVTVTLASLQMALEQLSQVVGQNQDQLRATMYNLRLATESLKDFGRKVEQQPSRLLFDDAPDARELP